MTAKEILDGCDHGPIRVSSDRGVEVTQPCRACADRAVEVAREEERRRFHGDACHCANCDGWRIIVKLALETATPAECEACAKLVDAYPAVEMHGAGWVDRLVAAIRARRKG